MGELPGSGLIKLNQIFFFFIVKVKIIDLFLLDHNFGEQILKEKSDLSIVPGSGRIRTLISGLNSTA